MYLLALFVNLFIRWEVAPQYDQYGQAHHFQEQHYGDPYSMNGYMAPLPFAPSSASYPGFVASHSRARSPSRVHRYEEDEYLRDAPQALSSQSYPSGYNMSFADAFLSGGLEDNVNMSPVGLMETTPQFGFPQQSPLGMSAPLADAPSPVEFMDQQTSTRKKPTGFFKVLEKFSISPVNFDFRNLVESVVNDPSQLSTMWSGILTGTKLDRNYAIMLFIMEKVFTRFLDETVRRLRDEMQSPQLAVFFRQIWTALLPVCSESVERWIVEYHETNAVSFCKDAETDEWDEEDEAREKIVDDLDQELEELQTEIDMWESIQRNYPSGCDDRAMRFMESRLLFSQRLNLLASVPGEASSNFLDGGFMEKPQLPAWEHPVRRKKLQIRDMLHASLINELGMSDAMFSSEDCAMGIPASGFCFEPGVVADQRWETWTSPGWIVDDQNVHNNHQKHHRLSVDALSAFN